MGNHWKTNQVNNFLVASFALSAKFYFIDTTLLNKVNKKRRKKQKNKKQSISNDGAKVAKPTELPCGAEIMRNIPRGKSKSGREWKPPKSK